MAKRGDLVYKGKNFSKDLWQVLSKIKELLLYTKKSLITHNDYFGIIQSDPTNKVSPSAELHILDRLQDMGVLKIEPYELTWDDYRNFNMISMPGAKTAVAKLNRPIPSFSSLEINKDKFDTIYREYSGVNPVGSDTSSILTFYLTRMGKLYRVLENGDEQSYQMERDSKRYLLIQVLAENAVTPLTADEIAGRIDSSAENIRKEVGKIRNEIGKHFKGVSGEKFIPLGQRKVGYIIGKGIKIKQE